MDKQELVESILWELEATNDDGELEELEALLKLVEDEATMKFEEYQRLSYLVAARCEAQARD